MKTLLSTRLHPALIVSSVFFWFVVVVLIYAFLMLYWIHKIFFVEDKNVNVYDGGSTIVIHKIGKTIYRKQLKHYRIF